MTEQTSNPAVWIVACAFLTAITVLFIAVIAGAVL